MTKSKLTITIIVIVLLTALAVWVLGNNKFWKAEIKYQTPQNESAQMQR